MEFDRQLCADAALVLAVLAGEVANFCDHAEHAEPADVEIVRSAGTKMRQLAVELSTRAGSDAIDLYVQRLRQIEERNVLPHRHALDSSALAREATTWRDLQLV